MTEIDMPRHWKRREEILRIIESLGTTRISKAELAKKYGVSPRQISKDFEAISEQIGKFKKKELNFDAYLIFEFSLNKLLEIARNEHQKPMEQIKAINALVNTVDKKIDNLIKFGLINPVEETINVKHSPQTLNRSINTRASFLEVLCKLRILYSSMLNDIIQQFCFKRGHAAQILTFKVYKHDFLESDENSVRKFQEKD